MFRRKIVGLTLISSFHFHVGFLVQFLFLNTIIVDNQKYVEAVNMNREDYAYHHSSGLLARGTNRNREALFNDVYLEPKEEEDQVQKIREKIETAASLKALKEKLGTEDSDEDPDDERYFQRRYSSEVVLLLFNIILFFETLFYLDSI